MSINWTQLSVGIVCILIGIASYGGFIDYWSGYSLVGIESLAVLFDWIKRRNVIG